MNGAQHILDAFHRHSISTVFGYPGGCIMPLYDALVDDVGVEHVLCRHEQACALAADGYARASGKLGVCIATSGPGATNLITGVANAHRDSIPMLVITGQVPSGLIGTDAFQETDVLGMTLGIVKHSYLVDDADSLPAIMEEAMELAQSGRPGPVWIDIPKDLLLADVSDAPFPRSEPREISFPDLAEALTMLRAARKPILYSGGGISLAHAEDRFRTFAESAALPAVVTLKGIGNPGKHNPYNLGMLGMHGSRAANKAVDECDLLLVIGARLDDRATGSLDGFAPNAKMIHIDADAAEINKLRPTELAIRGDLNDILETLTNALQDKPLDIGDWQKQCRTWYTTGGFHAADNEEPLAPITGPAFVRQLSRIAPDDTVIACDVGQHQMWVAQHYDFDHPRHHLTSGGLGTMGFGLPAAIGAQFSDRNSTVINVTGDGSFMMNAQELATIRRYNLPVKLIVMDNQCLGMVRQQQELFYGNRESQINLDDNPDFVAMARAFDIPALHISRTDQIRRGIETILAYNGPMLLHVAISREENVWPIVKPGASNREMIDETRRTNKKEHVA
ncbi:MULTISPECIES: acetolactate synthase 2 catalytic subunit [Marinobacter]|jgi:acetolactate synthase-1/2/3 large subunit|uniref:Acetolactate synthase n=1 Tax=Marinobacter salarius TaxID=1420917 RepID=W5Z0P1_9GAMM|nr:MULTISPECIES: acetolactate synthase 2 catalytic subunit [Marinobacter]AHI32058.1 acetolactate synthase [Marinobacter salarius]ARM84970.1 acetolactate synthase isozyme 2 large subunit [Marinobacter salarius]KXJ48876.1 MAG: acetolactate synthase catalytic subunit [Marinobacter sp. Hex_13]MBS8229567.1 acetolactate synthase 2 catalytic subunit [Marinobacter salarius]MCZ4284645.1 acetolactate synthase 2 catalytic subunit [Marinobacter salarius]|tara:strand:+ start:68 stop:1762 length:1695 start_codon:yes stop_codon:yes gene_type:complete